MRHTLTCLLFLSVAWAWMVPAICPGSDAQSGVAEARQVVSLDRGWRFHRGRLDLPGRQPVGGWRYRVDPRAAATDVAQMSSPDLDVSSAPWKDGSEFQHGRDTGGEEWKDGGNALAKGAMLHAWVRTRLPGRAAGRPTLEFESVQGVATVFVNGVKLGSHEGRKEYFAVDMTRVWRREGSNAIAVHVESIGWGGIAWPVHFVDLDAVAPTPSSQVHPEFDDRTWIPVDVPHDFVVEGPIQDQGADGYQRDLGWYRRPFVVPKLVPGARVWLEFDGISRMSQIWVNGTRAAVHPSAYAPCRIDATALVVTGRNSLVVGCDSRNAEGWWYDGGGIYRHVRMVVVRPVHVAPDSIRITTDLPSPGDGRTADAGIDVRSTLRNLTGAPATARIHHEILDPDGKPVQGAMEDLALPSTDQEHRMRLSLVRARLWSCEQPALYTLATTITVDGVVVDRVASTFGVRTAVFDPERGFLLNGRPVKLKGTCNHENHAGVGVAIPDRLQAWRLEQLKKMGGNAIRCSHNEYSPVVYDLCDRMGILVMDEFRQFSDCYLGKTTPGAAIGRLTDQRAQVLRNRNHPSIVIWSLCNEEGEVQGTAEGARRARLVKQMVDELDGTRPTTAALNGGFVREGTAGVTDVVGINYNIEQFDVFRARFPGKSLLSTEACSEVSTRGFHDRTPFANPMGWGPVLHGDGKRGYLSNYSENGPGWWRPCEETWKAVADRPWVAGIFVWTGFDYKGEPTPFSQPAQPSISSSFGILDTCGFPKDSYYYYRSWWSDEPTIHVFPHWNWPGHEGRKIPVWVHSNADEVELFLNGASLGRQSMLRNSHLEWQVPYAPGRLEARGIRGGRTITDAVETTEAPAGISLAPDRTVLTADGDDLAWVGVGIFDARSRLVPTAGNQVRFAVSGPGRILGVGNGDSSSHEPDKADRRSAFHGRCMVLIQTTGQSGDIVLTAEGDGLATARCTFRAK